MEEIEEIVNDLHKEDYFRLNVIKFLLKGVRAPSMYRGNLFRQRLEEILPAGTCADVELPFYCNAVRLETGGSVFWGAPGFQDVSLVDAVYSSCALPGIFEPFEHDGYHYMDGGHRRRPAAALRTDAEAGPDDRGRPDDQGDASRRPTTRTASRAPCSARSRSPRRC